MVFDVLRHRLVLSFEALSDDVSADQILASIVGRVPVPVVPLQDPRGVRVGA
jgi:MoxR-like ATPase